LLGRKFLLPLAFEKKIILLLRGVTVRTIWIESNYLTFNNTRWEAPKLKKPFDKD
jgi:hypothetical protein